MPKRALSILVHGQSKVGKTTFAMTAPYPRLLLDVEAAARFLPNNMRDWDPMTEPVPVADGTWDTVVVDVDSFEVALKAYEVLKSGRHQFRSVILDSVSELQAKAIEDVNGRNQFLTQHWGQLLSKLSFFCRDLRDLTKKKNNPIEAVVLTAMTKKYDTQSDGSGGIFKPFLQGQISSQAPYWFDITAYLFELQYKDPNSGQIATARRLLTGKNPEYEAGNRAHLPDFVDYPNVEHLLEMIYGPKQEVQATQATVVPDVAPVDPDFPNGKPEPEESVNTETGELSADVQSEEKVVESNKAPVAAGLKLPALPNKK